MSATKVFAAALIHSVASANYILTHLHDFHQLDANHDGTLTRDEYIEVAEETAKTDFDRMDLDGDGIIGEEEYETVVDQVRDAKENPIAWTGDTEADVALVVARMDLDGDFKVTYEEYRATAPIVFANEDREFSPEDMATIFNQFDLYDEGYATFDTILEWAKLDKELRGPFNEADQDGDGYLSFEEFKAAGINMREGASNEELELAFSIWDKDSNGKLSYQDEVFAEAHKSMAALKNIERRAELLDANEDSHISREEMRNYFREHEDTELSDDALDLIMAKYDSDEDGKVSKVEYSLAEFGAQVEQGLIDLMKHMAKVFVEQMVSHLDADGNGILGLSELQAMYLSLHWTDDDIKHYTDFIDVDDDGVIHVDEAVEELIKQAILKVEFESEFRKIADEGEDFFYYDDLRVAYPEWPESQARDYWNMYNVNGDEYLTYEEMCSQRLNWWDCPYEREPEDNPEDEFETIWYQLDTDRNDVLTFEEFINSPIIKAAYGDEPDTDLLHSLFHEYYDLNRDGIVTKEEARKAEEYHNGGGTSQNPMIQGAIDLFNIYDKDYDGVISMDDFHYAMTNLSFMTGAAISDLEISQLFELFGDEQNSVMTRDQAIELATVVLQSGLSLQ